MTAKPDDRPTDDGDVSTFRSTDQGQTWDSPLGLNTDDSDHLQFFPAISVDPDGIVHAMWGDIENDPHEVRYDIYYSESSDRGSTWRAEVGTLTTNLQQMSAPPTLPRTRSWDLLAVASSVTTSR